MTFDPHALEALLEKVQRNRDKPRTSGIPEAPRSSVPVPSAEPMPRMPIAAERAPSFAPVEEDELEADPFGEASIPPRAPSHLPEPEPMRAAPSNRPKPIITFPPSVPPPGEDTGMPRRGSGVPSQVEGSILSAPPAPHATRPIAQVVSRHPTAENATFGQLLTRSLSLRAR